MADQQPTRSTGRRATTRTPDSYTALPENQPPLDPKTQEAVDRYLHGQPTNPDGSTQ